MYLKELTLRGFKSFASATRFRFEPGITAVVGPNGSGKSNVVDALAWVMGEQGAKSLRGGNMSDVIFAGGTSRSPLGRAQVELTIDNSDGRLPIAFSEVTISRTMFRSGGSEYAINRQPVRLLDVQELLSDSGLGRQMHVIVGQGQLDTVLSASPTDRRAFIDEAAGVAKHRRRKERALRKLESMDANLVRVLDLTAEMKTSLRPLARQAKAAREAEGIQRVLAYSQARILAEDLVEATAKLERERETLIALRSALEKTDAQCSGLKAQREALSQEESLTRQGAEVVAERYRDFTEQRGRFLSLAELAEERGLSAARVPAAVSETATELAAKRSEEAHQEALEAETLAQSSSAALEAATEQRRSLEPSVAEAERALAAAQERVEQQRLQKERGAARLQSAELALEARRGEAQAAESRLEAARQRLQAATATARDYSESHSSAAPGEGGQEAQTYERAAEEERAARQALQEEERTERTLLETQSAARSKRETLESSLATHHNVKPALKRAEPASWGVLEGHVKVQSGWEDAVAALLGSLASAKLISDAEAFLEAAEDASLNAEELGYSGYVLAEPESSRNTAEDTKAGTSPGLETATEDPQAPGKLALSAVSAQPSLMPVLRALLEDAYLVEDAAAGFLLLKQLESAAGHRDPGPLRVTVATRSGVLLGEGFTRFRGEPQRSRLFLLADLEQARASELAAQAKLRGASAKVQQLRESLAQCSKRRSQALEQLRAADAAKAAVAQEGARLSALVQAAQVDMERIHSQVADSQSRASSAESALRAAREEIHSQSATDEPVDLSEFKERLESLNQSLRSAFEKENQARLEAQVSKERALSARRQAQAFATQAESLREERKRQMARSQRAQQAKDAFGKLSAGARQNALRAEAAATRARDLRDGLRDRLSAMATSGAALAEELKAAEIRRGAESESLLQSEVTHAGQQAAVRSLEEKALGLVSEQGRLLELRLPTHPGLRAYSESAETAETAEPAESAKSAERDDSDQFVSSPEPELEVPEQTELWDEAAEAASDLIAKYGPHIPWAPSVQGGDEGEAEAALPTSRAEAAEAIIRSSRQLTRLGVVNPLAVEEYEAASSRYRFLTEQVEDLNRSKADLLSLIREIDEQVKTAFEAAFADTAKNFEHTFSRLFPGGTGRLELTDPEDPLSTGVEIYARPSGKRVTRLSLLSGGERSLAALAYLIAIFEARPSPFYVMDEVEAALDDVNLSRVLSLLEDLRTESQLLVITHQKRTMETADALYGVTMQGGVTAVMSHRMAS